MIIRNKVNDEKYIIYYVDLRYVYLIKVNCNFDWK